MTKLLCRRRRRTGFRGATATSQLLMHEVIQGELVLQYNLRILAVPGSGAHHSAQLAL